jgi:hypothetical protein
MHIYIQDSDRNYMKMNKNASVWTKLKFNFNFVHFSLFPIHTPLYIVKKEAESITSFATFYFLQFTQ